MKENLQNVLLPLVTKFTTTKSMIALKNGITATIPLTMIGSIFLIIAAFPVPAFKDYIESIGVRAILLQAFNANYGILALVVAFAVAYFYAVEEQLKGMNAGIISLVTFILFLEHSVSKDVEGTMITIGSAINMDWLGAKGMVGAIIIGIITGKVYCFFVKRGITIKMPDSVPEGVANSFISIIPGAVIITGATALFALLKMQFHTTLLEFIYKAIQTPLQGLTSSLFGVIAFSFIVSFLWWFGIHGASIMAGIFQAITISNATFNQAILDKGEALTAANGYIFTENFRTTIIIITGSGITIGIVLYMLFFAKSAQFKELGKLAIVPSIFNINEPILFGTPIVLNPTLFIPFCLTPVLSATVGYLLMKFNILPLMGSILPPWSTPPIMSGFLAGGIRIAIYQIVVIIMSFVIYFPFIKKVDEEAYKLEKGE